MSQATAAVTDDLHTGHVIRIEDKAELRLAVDLAVLGEHAQRFAVEAGPVRGGYGVTVLGDLQACVGDFADAVGR